MFFETSQWYNEAQYSDITSLYVLQNVYGFNILSCHCAFRYYTELFADRQTDRQTNGQTNRSTPLCLRTHKVIIIGIILMYLIDDNSLIKCKIILFYVNNYSLNRRDIHRCILKHLNVTFERSSV